MSTMQIDRGVVEQAMGAMLNFDGDISDEMFESIRSLRAALAERGVVDCHLPLQAEPVQEPVAWRYKPMIGSLWSLSDDGYYISCKRDKRYIIEPLYTAPPQRQPLSLTDLQEALVLTNLVDRDAIDDSEEYDEGSTLAQIDELHRIIERAHSIGEQS